jgi:hypothetical protein
VGGDAKNAGEPKAHELALRQQFRKRRVHAGIVGGLCLAPVPGCRVVHHGRAVRTKGRLLKLAHGFKKPI